MRRELEHLRNHVEYYQNTTHAVIMLRFEFMGQYNNFKLARDLHGPGHELPREDSNRINNTQRHDEMV